MRECRGDQKDQKESIQTSAMLLMHVSKGIGKTRCEDESGYIRREELVGRHL